MICLKKNMLFCFNTFLYEKFSLLIIIKLVSYSEKKVIGEIKKNLEIVTMKEKYIQVITTTDNKEDAEKISDILLNRRLAGCIQIIGPITSTYWWKDKIEKASEWLCIIKSMKNLFEDINKSIREIHSYETPEILVVPIVNGDDDYLKWLDDTLKK